jgi:hypothetical protein
MPSKIVTLRKANPTVRVGLRFRYPDHRTVWRIDKIVERGVVVVMDENGSHKHMSDWEIQIQPL